MPTPPETAETRARAVQKSTYISAGGHALVLGYALFGGLFTAEPLELPTVDVSIVSEAEFAALTQAAQPPDVVQDVPEPVLAAPDPEPEPVVVPQPESTPPVTPEAPEITPLQPVQPAPDPLPEPDPVPEPPQPEPVEEVVVIPDVAPDASLRPKPRPADRVAPDPIAAPDPAVEIDNTAQEATQPDPAADQVVEEQSETAPEEAATEIVTEAEQPASSAPSQSIRPRPRPRTPQVASEPEQDSTADAVSAALAEALGEATATEEAPSGPPLTAGETDALRLAVQNCWQVDVGSQSANVTVVVGMSMDQRGKVVPGSLRLVSSSGGEGVAVEAAFQAARRAVLICQKDGYALPVEKYEQWKEIEMTFNPKDMRIR